MTPERKRCGNHAGPDFTPCTRDADHTGPCAHALKEHPAPSMMLTPAMEAEIREHVAMRWTRHTWLGALLALVDSLRSEVEASEETLSDIAESLGEQCEPDADLAGILNEIDEAVPHYTCDSEGEPSTRLAERIGFLVMDHATEKARADSLAGELATLRAAYEGLREAASELSDIFADGFNAADIDSFTVQPIRIALNAAPASLAGKVRAAVLREAAAWCRDQSAVDERLPPEYLADGLLSLAEEAERG